MRQKGQTPGRLTLLQHAERISRGSCIAADTGRRAWQQTIMNASAVDCTQVSFGCTPNKRFTPEFVTGNTAAVMLSSILWRATCCATFCVVAGCRLCGESVFSTGPKDGA